MKGDPKVLAHLNEALKLELTAINQYFLHARMLDDWGLTKMGKHEYEESIEEMKHADLLIQRILFLEGLPNLQTLDKLNIGENVEEIIKGDLAAELKGVAHYKEAIKAAEAAHDYVSRDLFIQLLKDEEGHVDMLETMLENIRLQGLENFIQMQSDAAGEGGNAHGH
jgi:bacterioferritin